MSIFATIIRRRARSCVVLAGLILSSAHLFAVTTNVCPERMERRYRLGPFFEYRTTYEGAAFWAIRPFFSRLVDPVCDTQVSDCAWPLGTFHRDREQSWWRLALAYGSDNDVRRDESAWKTALFPIWFQGRSRQGEDYWAIFPLYGHLPHVLLMEDIDFFLFPLYLNYAVNGVERDYYLWPVFSRMGHEPETKRAGIFPLYGQTLKRESRHLYAFWPFWTSAVYEGKRNPGYSWMLFPLAGQVNRDKEKQWLLVPPFISHAVTDGGERWRLPWPFIQTATNQTSRQRSFWPLYGDRNQSDGRSWYALWPLIEHFSLSAKDRRTERSRFFPFYVSETTYGKDLSGVEQVEETYTRVWPFYSREKTERGTKMRALELSLIRYSGGIERNWAPLWTVYTRSAQDGDVVHDALWGLMQFRTTRPLAVQGEDEP